MSFKLIYSMCLNRVWRNIFNTNRLCMNWSKAYISESNFRRFSSKPKNELPHEIKILLKDKNGNILGLHTKTSAELLANKLKLILVEEVARVENKANHKVFQLTPISKLLKDDTISEVDHNSLNQTKNETIDSEKTGKHQTKRIAFSTKFTEHDLQVKINAIKNWLKKGIDVWVTITSNPNEKRLLESIHKRIASECKCAKFIQKSFKEKELKFSILSTPECKDLNVETSHDDHNNDFNIDDIDSNKLLNEDIDKLFKDK